MFCFLFYLFLSFFLFLFSLLYFFFLHLHSQSTSVHKDSMSPIIHSSLTAFVSALHIWQFGLLLYTKVEQQLQFKKKDQSELNIKPVLVRSYSISCALPFGTLQRSAWWFDIWLIWFRPGLIKCVVWAGGGVCVLVVGIGHHGKKNLITHIFRVYVHKKSTYYVVQFWVWISDQVILLTLVSQ